MAKAQPAPAPTGIPVDVVLQFNAGLEAHSQEELASKAWDISTMLKLVAKSLDQLSDQVVPLKLGADVHALWTIVRHCGDMAEGLGSILSEGELVAAKAAP